MRRTSLYIFFLEERDERYLRYKMIILQTSRDSGRTGGFFVGQRPSNVELRHIFHANYSQDAASRRRDSRGRSIQGLRHFHKSQGDGGETVNEPRAERLPSSRQIVLQLELRRGWQTSS